MPRLEVERMSSDQSLDGGLCRNNTQQIMSRLPSPQKRISCQLPKSCSSSSSSSDRRVFSDSETSATDRLRRQGQEVDACHSPMESRLHAPSSGTRPQSRPTGGDAAIPTTPSQTRTKMKPPSKSGLNLNEIRTTSEENCSDVIPASASFSSLPSSSSSSSSSSSYSAGRIAVSTKNVSKMAEKKPTSRITAPTTMATERSKTKDLLNNNNNNNHILSIVSPTDDWDENDNTQTTNSLSLVPASRTASSSSISSTASSTLTTTSNCKRSPIPTPEVTPDRPSLESISSPHAGKRTSKLAPPSASSSSAANKALKLTKLASPPPLGDVSRKADGRTGGVSLMRSHSSGDTEKSRLKRFARVPEKGSNPSIAGGSRCPVTSSSSASTSLIMSDAGPDSDRYEKEANQRMVSSAGSCRKDESHHPTALALKTKLVASGLGNGSLRSDASPGLLSPQENQFLPGSGSCGRDVAKATVPSSRSSGLPSCLGIGRSPLRSQSASAATPSQLRTPKENVAEHPASRKEVPKKSEINGHAPTTQRDQNSTVPGAVTVVKQGPAQKLAKATDGSQSPNVSNSRPSQLKLPLKDPAPGEALEKRQNPRGVSAAACGNAMSPPPVPIRSHSLSSAAEPRESSERPSSLGKDKGSLLTPNYCLTSSKAKSLTNSPRADDDIPDQRADIDENLPSPMEGTCALNIKPMEPLAASPSYAITNSAPGMPQFPGNMSLSCHDFSRFSSQHGPGGRALSNHRPLIDPVRPYANAPIAAQRRLVMGPSISNRASLLEGESDWCSDVDTADSVTGYMSEGEIPANGHLEEIGSGYVSEGAAMSTSPCVGAYYNCRKLQLRFRNGMRTVRERIETGQQFGDSCNELDSDSTSGDVSGRAATPRDVAEVVSKTTRGPRPEPITCQMNPSKPGYPHLPYASKEDRNCPTTAEGKGGPQRGVVAPQVDWDKYRIASNRIDTASNPSIPFERGFVYRATLPKTAKVVKQQTCDLGTKSGFGKSYLKRNDQGVVSPDRREGVLRAPVDARNGETGLMMKQSCPLPQLDVRQGKMDSETNTEQSMVLLLTHKCRASPSDRERPPEVLRTFSPGQRGIRLPLSPSARTESGGDHARQTQGATGLRSPEVVGTGKGAAGSSALIDGRMKGKGSNTSRGGGGGSGTIGEGGVGGKGAREGKRDEGGGGYQKSSGKKLEIFQSPRRIQPNSFASPINPPLALATAAFGFRREERSSFGSSGIPLGPEEAGACLRSGRSFSMSAADGTTNLYTNSLPRIGRPTHLTHANTDTAISSSARESLVLDDRPPTSPNSISPRSSTGSQSSWSKLAIRQSIGSNCAGSKRMTNKDEDLHGSMLSLISTASSVYSSSEEKQVQEVRKLRRELEMAQEKINTLTTQLSTNVHVVSAFEQSLANMTQRLQKLTVTTELKDAELGELRTTLQSLHLQSRNHFGSQSSNGRLLQRQLSLVPKSSKTDSEKSMVINNLSMDDVMLSSSMSGSAAADFCDANSLMEKKQKKKTNWLKNPFTKAFSRKKHKPSSDNDSDAVSIRSDTSVPNSPLLTTSRTVSVPSTPIANSSRKLQAPFVRVSGDYTSSPAGPPPQSPTQSVEVVLQLQQQLHEKDMKLTDVRLEALSSAHQLEQLKDTMNRMKGEIVSLRSENDRMQKVIQHRGLDDCPSPTVDSKKQGVTPKISLDDPYSFDAITVDSLNKDGGQITVCVRLSPSVSDQSNRQANRVMIGVLSVTHNTGWETLENSIRHLLTEYVRRVDPGTSLGLNASGLSSYKVGEITRSTGSSLPELLPCGYLVGENMNIVLTLKGPSENCVDALAFETLVPKSILQRYVSLLLDHRRMILCGPSGTGKTYLAQKLAEYLIIFSGKDASTGVIATFNVDHKSGKELRQYLSNVADQCEASASDLPDVIILDNLHHVASLGEAFNPFLGVKFQLCPYIIGTMSQTGSTSTNLQLHHNFRWVLCANHVEPVRGFLGRFLQRRLVEEEVSCNMKNPEMEKIVDWLPRVWQHLNKFLEAHCSSDVTIGPRLFLSCPMDAKAAQIWFTDLWNYSIVPYLLEAVREGVQTYGAKVKWEDPTDWVIGHYPWTETEREGSSRGDRKWPSLLHLRPEDVNLDPLSLEDVKAAPPSDASSVTEPEAGGGDPLMNMLLRLQEAASYSSAQSNDSDTTSLDSHDSTENQTLSAR